MFAAPALLLGGKAQAEDQSEEEFRARLEECNKWMDIRFIWDTPDIRFPVESFGDDKKEQAVWEHAFNFPAGRLKCSMARLDNWYRSEPFAKIIADFIDRREEFAEWTKWAADNGIHEIASKAYICDKNPMVISPRDHRFFRIEPVNQLIVVKTSRPMTALSLVQLLNLGYWLPREEFPILYDDFLSGKGKADQFSFFVSVPIHQVRAWIAETNNDVVTIMSHPIPVVRG